MLLNSNNRSFFLSYLHKDKISNFYTIYDIVKENEFTKVWFTVDNNSEVSAYLLQYHEEIIASRGDPKFVRVLFEKTDVHTASFDIEKEHKYKHCNPLWPS